MLPIFAILPPILADSNLVSQTAASTVHSHTSVAPDDFTSVSCPRLRIGFYPIEKDLVRIFVCRKFSSKSRLIGHLHGKVIG